jgi:hypothetical protein
MVGGGGRGGGLQEGKNRMNKMFYREAGGNKNNPTDWGILLVPPIYF